MQGLLRCNTSNINKYNSTISSNIGFRKLANISSGMTEHRIHNKVNWCFNVKNVGEANQKIVGAIQDLDLANNYLNNPSIFHSGSDGRKVNVAVDSLHANFSYKYLGKDKVAIAILFHRYYGLN